MEIAKIFTNGRSQAVRLPKEYRFSSDSVYIKKIDNMIILIPKEHIWSTFSKSLDRFPDDFMNDYKNPSLEQRETI
ncbi:MAG: AbrB/MazE/SpoVT family DNA-binding domain-containing protein [Leptospiraceae bacterium]|nr:AbrB/MazE/SpoVT family DNA-binding domain-containing protein [Leptospiraceae bacterium]MCP5496389.1 AbrB/MazE/SpoVT family DNA-binding domain-containing protein [Leptospiraceae bacterium]